MTRVQDDRPVKFLSVLEAAELLRVSPRMVYGWSSQGVIPHQKAGRRLIFLESEVIDFTKPDLRRHQY
jgi:excisionase family DNA binding protein